MSEIAKSQEQPQLNEEVKQWMEYHSYVRERIESKKNELERLLRSDIIKDVTHGLELNGFRITSEKVIMKEGEKDPFCGFDGVTGDGIERAALMIAMFEMYMDYAHVQDVKRRKEK